MDPFDYTDVKVRPPIDVLSVFLNLLTLLVLMMTCCVGLVILVVYTNPYIAINPFPPPTLPALAALPTPTPTPLISLPPTWTPTPLSDLASMSTPMPAPTEASAEITTAPEVYTETTPEAIVTMPFVLQAGDPVAIANVSHPELGCGWMGVAGQVTGLDNAPLPGLMVQLGGVLEGRSMLPVTLTGTATQYGEGGYEFTLSDGPVASENSLWVQLLEQDGRPLSEKVFFDTYAECDKALILVNFVQID